MRSQGQPGFGRAERRDSLPGRVQTLHASATEPARARHRASKHAFAKGSVLPRISETRDTEILSPHGAQMYTPPQPGMQSCSQNCWTPVFLPLSCCSLYLHVGRPPVTEKQWPRGQAQPQGTGVAQAAHAGSVGSIGTAGS